MVVRINRKGAKGGWSSTNWPTMHRFCTEREMFLNKKHKKMFSQFKCTSLNISSKVSLMLAGRQVISIAKWFAVSCIPEVLIHQGSPPKTPSLQVPTWQVHIVRDGCSFQSYCGCWASGSVNDNCCRFKFQKQIFFFLFFFMGKGWWGDHS